MKYRRHKGLQILSTICCIFEWLRTSDPLPSPACGSSSTNSGLIGELHIWAIFSYNQAFWYPYASTVSCMRSTLLINRCRGFSIIFAAGIINWLLLYLAKGLSNGSFLELTLLDDHEGFLAQNEFSPLFSIHGAKLLRLKINCMVSN